MKKDDDDGGTTGDELALLVQKLRWLRLPGMAKLVAAILERAAKDNLSTLAGFGLLMSISIRR